MPGSTEKRQHTRFVCDGGVEVRESAEGARGFWGTMADISLGGCYIQTFSPMNAGTGLGFLIKTHGLEIRGAGRVVAMHPGVGMGIAFTELSANDQQILKKLIATLEADDKHQTSGLLITP